MGGTDVSSMPGAAAADAVDAAVAAVDAAEAVVVSLLYEIKTALQLAGQIRGPILSP
jgi:hypothetical protein